jgi:hypothetical protein
MEKAMLKTFLGALVLLCGAIGGAEAQSSSGNAVPVTTDNFNRAETDMYFAQFVKRGTLGKFTHRRDLPLEGTGVRPSRDMLYSEALFDLDAGPVKVTLPKTGKRFMSMTAINETHYVFEVAYGGGNYTYSRAEVGTRYLFVALRILVNPADPQDVKQANALQDAIVVKQKGTGQFEVTNWDPVSHKKVRDLLLALNTTLPDLQRAFGSKSQVDSVRHLIGTASAWGGIPDKEILHLNVTPAKNDGVAVYRLLVPAKVPVDGLWSITVYDADGRLQKNQQNAYGLNSVTAKKSADGSAALQFGGCDGKAANCLPTMKGWTYTVRLYRPRDEILNGKWKFPEAQAVN